MKVKTISDYYDVIQERFPQVDMKDIKTILNFGWKSFYLHNSYGGDVCVTDNNFWCYCGVLLNNSVKFFKRYIERLSLKIRVLYKRRKIKWDGYYYFALSNKQYEDYKSQIKPVGRKRKKFKFNKIFLYKILDECKVRQSAYPYIFRTQMPVELGYRLYYEETELDNCELIIQREPLKFKDVLVTNNDYELL